MIATDLHADILALLHRMLQTQAGEVITHADLSKAIGRDIRRCRHLFYDARDIANEEHGAMFAGLRGIGYRRMPTEDAFKVGQTARAKIRSTAQRGSRTIACGIKGKNNLSNDAHRRALAEMSALGMLEFLARDRNLPKVDPHATKPPSVAAVAQQVAKALGIPQSRA